MFLAGRVMNSHRGRIQMQGGGIELSEAWAAAQPPSAAEARAMIARLMDRLPARERRLRAVIAVRAAEFVEHCIRRGGVEAQVIRSFKVDGDRKARRLDIEVHAGKAFTS